MAYPDMPALESVLAGYVPDLILRPIATGARARAEPGAEPSPAALLLADVSGSTALAERLAERGARGAEDLCAFSISTSAESST